jgi:mRNA-degrading endonuclease YafQ of YafQ-DinJ toxin-antitoxin module
MESYKVSAQRRFERRAGKLGQRDAILGEKIRLTMHRLSRDPFFQNLRTHKVQTKKHGYCFSSRVSGDIRILWNFSELSGEILLLDIGGHSGKGRVYR